MIDPPSFRQVAAKIKETPAVSYVLDADLAFVYCNPAWDHFAIENGAPGLAEGTILGSPLFAVIPDELRPLYANAFAHVRQTGEVWQCTYECSSPQKFRQFRMRIHWLIPDLFLVTNTLAIEAAHANISNGNLDGYLSPGGAISMCSHCRCTRRIDAPEQWDFVPTHLELSPKVAKISHGLCPICRTYFYPSTIPE